MIFLNNKVLAKSGMTSRVRKFLQNSIKVGNFILGIYGVAILLYSAWMLNFCLQNSKDLISAWFLWACTSVGTMFCLVAGLGYAAAAWRNWTLLFYVVLMFWLLFMEILVIADVSLNDHWKKDFPCDPTQRFENFITYVEMHAPIFKFLGTTLILLQICAFLLALFLRTMFDDVRTHLDNDAANVPFLNHHFGTYPYAVGTPHPAPNDATITKDEDKQSMLYSQEDIWMMNAGCPPYYC